MGTTERRERQKAELRDQILAAAARVIADEGFDALTMRKIAEAIEYSPATIYLHFANRDDIALALVRDGFAQLDEHIAAAAAGLGPLERLRAIGRAYLAFAASEPQTYRLIFMEEQRFSEPLMLALKAADAEDGGEGAFDLLVATCAALIESGAFRPADAHLVASLLWASLHGIAALHLSCGEFPFAGDIGAPGDAMIDVLIRGLRA